MTLREIGESFASWLEGILLAIERDARIVLSENVLDWPLWTLPVVALLAYGTLIVALSLLAWLAAVGIYLARLQKDNDGRFRLGVVIVARQLAFGVGRLLLLAVMFLGLMIWVMALGYLLTSQGPIWLSGSIVAIGALVLAGLFIAARRGRRLRIMEQPDTSAGK